MELGPITIAEQTHHAGVTFPLVLSPSSPDPESDSLSELLVWIRTNHRQLKALMVQHGALLFRGCPVRSPEDFEAMLEAGRFENMPYIGGAAPRSQVTPKRVLTSNESPPSEPIPFHHEMAQVPTPPAYVFFYCDHPSDDGGETPIIDSRQVYRRFSAIAPEFAQKLEQLGVRYVRIMPCEDDPSSAIGRSWKSTFLTDDQDEAERRMTDLGTTWNWLPSGDLHTETATVPAIRTDPRTGEKTFFNSVVAAYTGWVDSRNVPTRSVRCGDGSAVDGSAILATSKAMTEDCVAFRWQRGDVLWIDNHLVMHSRRPFTGTRRILAAIASG